MANLNKVMMIGRLTREPESRTFANGGKVVSFGFAVNNRRKNKQTGQWEDYPMFIDCQVFNRGDTGKKADIAEQYLHKGHQAYLEGHLVLDQWDDKTTGQKRSKHVFNVDDFQFLEPRKDGEGGGNYQRQQPAAVSHQSGPPQQDHGGYDDMEPPGPGPSGKDSADDIPF